MGKAKVNKDGGREPVKLRMEVVQKVRKHKEETGVAISTFFERAAVRELEREELQMALIKAAKG